MSGDMTTELLSFLAFLIHLLLHSSLVGQSGYHIGAYKYIRMSPEYVTGVLQGKSHIMCISLLQIGICTDVQRALFWTEGYKTYAAHPIKLYTVRVHIHINASRYKDENKFNLQPKSSPQARKADEVEYFSLKTTSAQVFSPCLEHLESQKIEGKKEGIFSFKPAPGAQDTNIERKNKRKKYATVTKSHLQKLWLERKIKQIDPYGILVLFLRLDFLTEMRRELFHYKQSHP
ncbi:hypothetical protein C0J52_16020 [Blattella germanica]|nr:hypothetical protein C0J52_16020 [Blattella germanica]